MKKIIASALTLLLPACTTTLDLPKVGETRTQPGYYPVRAPSDNCSNKSIDIETVGAADSAIDNNRLQAAVCRLRMKEYNTLLESQSFENSGGLRNLPLIGAVTAIAAIVLFGKRTASGDLKPGENKAIQALGLGGAAVSALSSYLDPATARKTLRLASVGYGCMANHADLILQEAGTIRGKGDQARLLEGLLFDLNRTIAAAPAGFDVSRAKAVADRAGKALDAFRLQERSLRSANIYLHDAEWSFGVDVLTRTDRADLDIDKLVAAIQEQQKSMVNFDQLKGKPAAPPAAGGHAVMGRPIIPVGNALTDAVEAATDQLLAGLVNIEALVLGFDTCSTAALAGARAPMPKLAAVKLQ